VKGTTLAELNHINYFKNNFVIKMHHCGIKIGADNTLFDKCCMSVLPVLIVHILKLFKTGNGEKKNFGRIKLYYLF
jgi:hypothetical protein